MKARVPKPMRSPSILLCAGVALVACQRGAPGSVGKDGRTEIAITVDDVGYHPAEAHAKAGEPVRLIVTRTADDECGKEFVIPSLNLKKELPLEVPVSIELTMPKSGKLAFACGMDMMRGSIIAD